MKRISPSSAPPLRTSSLARRHNQTTPSTSSLSQVVEKDYTDFFLEAKNSIVYYILIDHFETLL